MRISENFLGSPKQAEGMHTVNRELETLKSKMGFIDRWVLDKNVAKEAKRALSEGYLQLIEAKRQEMVAKITLGLDEAKKRALVEAMRHNSEIDHEIGELSEEFSAALLDHSYAGYVSAAKAEAKKLAELEELLQRNLVTPRRYEQLKEAAEETADHLSLIIKDVAARIIAGHVEKVRLALQLFKERQMPSI